jgi:hypothetical protein
VVKMSWIHPKSSRRRRTISPSLAEADDVRAWAGCNSGNSRAEMRRSPPSTGRMYRYMYTSRLVSAEAERDSMQGRLTIDMTAFFKALQPDL